MSGSGKGGARAALAPIGLVLAVAAQAPSVAAQAPSAAAPAPTAGALDDPAALESTAWRLDDGRGDELPWDDVDRSYDPLPSGPVHFAAQLRLGGIAGGHGQAAEGPAAEVAGILDVRYGHGPWHLRLGVVLDLRWSEPTSDAFNLYQSSAFSVRARLQPIAVDFGNVVSVRAGGDLGAQWVEDGGGGHFEVLPAVSGELVLRLFDATLELGPYGGIQFTASDARDPSLGFAWTAMVFQGVFGVFAAYVMP